MMAENRCVCCGEIIPEGMIACPNCLVASKEKEVRLIDGNKLSGLYDMGAELEQYAAALSVPIPVIRQNIMDTPTVDAVEVSRLGKLGRLMMPYKGCPRGRMGASGATGGEMRVTALDTIVDAEGDRWVPVLEEDLNNLKARLNNATEVVHGRWDFVGEACVCSACHNASIQDYYFCPECGAKMDGDRNA